MSDEQMLAAQVEFQARMTAVHQAQAQLNEIESRLRRLAIDQSAFGASTQREQVRLNRQRERLAEQLQSLQAKARVAHTVLRRLTDPRAEPDDVVVELQSDGYEQPHFASDDE